MADKRDNPLLRLLESQEIYLGIIGDDIHEMKNDNKTFHEQSLLVEKQDIKTNATINANEVLQNTKLVNELNDIEEQLSPDNELVQTLKNINKSLENSNTERLLHEIKGVLSKSIPVNQPQLPESKEKPVERVESSKTFKGLRELLDRSVIKQHGLVGSVLLKGGWLGKQLLDRRLAKKYSKEFNLDLDKRFTLRGIASKGVSNVKDIVKSKIEDTTTSLIDKVSSRITQVAQLVADKRFINDYVNKVSRSHSDVFEGKSESEIKKLLTTEAKELRKSAKEYVKLEKHYNTLKELDTDEKSELMTTLKSKMKEISKFIDNTDKSDDAKKVKGDVVDKPTQPDTETVKLSPDSIKTITTTQRTELNRLNEEDRNNISEEEKLQNSFNEKLLEVEESQLDIQTKIYRLLNGEIGTSSGKPFGVMPETEEEGNGSTALKVAGGAAAAGLGAKLLSKGKGLLATDSETATKLVSPAVKVVKSGFAGAKAIASGAGEIAERVLPNTLTNIVEKSKTVVPAVAGAAKKITPKIVQNLSSKISASITKHLPGEATKIMGKSIPFLGAAIGGGFAIKDLIEGDYVGAGLDLVGGLGSAVTAIPAAVLAVSRDVYKDTYGIDPEVDPEFSKRMPEIKDAVSKEFEKLLNKESSSSVEKTTTNNNDVTPIDTTGIGEVNGKPIDTPQIVVKDYETELKDIESARVDAAKELSDTGETQEDIEVFYSKIDKLKDRKADVIATKNNISKADAISKMESYGDPTLRTFYNLKPEKPEQNRGQNLYDTNNELVKINETTNTTSSNAQQNSSGNTTINNVSNNTTIIRKDVRNPEQSANDLFRHRKFNN